MLALGWTLLPGSPVFWTLLAMVVVATPLLLYLYLTIRDLTVRHGAGSNRPASEDHHE